MARPAAGYQLASGEKCPGTTTVIGRFKNSGALIGWAYKQGKAGVPLYESRDKAADIGTLAHEMVEARIHRRDPQAVLAGKDDETATKARSAFSAYERWAEKSKIVIVETEAVLVSEQYRFGGTLDALGMIGNELCLLEWKSAAGIYTDFLVQMAAYKHLWEVNHPEAPITGGCHLLRFAKEFADFSEHHYVDLSDAWEQFTLFRRAYEIDKQLEKRAK